MKKYSKEELIEFLKALSTELGKTPTIVDLIGKKNSPSYIVYYTRFGSWNTALKSSGLSINSEKKIYSDKELVDYLIKFNKINSRSPKTEDFLKNKDLPSPKAYFRRFGSWNNALKRAGLKINVRKNYTKDELLELLNMKAKKLGRSPMGDDVNNDKKMPDRSTYDFHFGTMNNALKLAGLEVKYHFRIWVKEELLQKLREKATELGRTPTQRDLDKDSSMPAKGNYRKYFGSFTHAVREANLPVKRFWSEKELVKALQQLYLKLNRTPTREELKKDSDCPSLTPFVEKFGSYTAACLRAGLVPNDGRNNKIWKGWEKHCIKMAKIVYGKIEVKNDKVVDGVPDIYVSQKKLFIDAKTCGYRDFKGQIKKYCSNGHKLEFWLIFKGLETKSKKVKYIYAEELAGRMKQLGREDLAVKCYQFIRNVFDEGQKVLV